MEQTESPSKSEPACPWSVRGISIASTINGIVLLCFAAFAALIFIDFEKRPYDLPTTLLFFARFAGFPGLAGAVGYALIHSGSRVWEGRTSNITWNGIGSIVLGLAILCWSTLLILYSGIAGLLPLLLGILFVAAGVSVLLSRKEYAAWLVTKRTQEGPNESPTKYAEKLGFCRTCKGEALIRRRKPNHAAHFFLSLLFGGLWLPVWYAGSVYGHPWKCSVCGRKVHSEVSWKAVFEGLILAGVLVMLIFLVAAFWARVITTPAAYFGFPGD